MDRVYFILSSARPEEAANLLARRGVPFHELEITEGRLAFWVPREWRGRVRDTPGAAVESESERGIRRTIRDTRRRVTLYLGLFAAVAALILTSGTIWSIEVHGAESVPEERIIALLREEGIHLFSPFWSVRSRRIQNDLLLAEPSLRWAALNLKGTKLYVLVREAVPAPPPAVPSPEPILARRFGIVSAVVCTEGSAAVMPGDTVLRGDELIVPGAGGAEGTVIARTFYEISAEMPAECTLKVRALSERTLTALLIGEKRINFYNSNRHSASRYDKIEYITPLPFLPVRIERVTVREYETAAFTRDAGSAESILRARLVSTLNAQIGSGSVTSERFSCSEEGGLIRVTLFAECRESIGDHQSYDRRNDSR